MAEEGHTSETSATIPQPAEAVSVAVVETLTESTISVETNLESVPKNSDNAAAEASAPASLELAEKLMDKGEKAMKINDYGEAADKFSRALEISVARYGELAPECVQTYYKYGCALLYKAQEEADPLADVPKKEGGSQHGSNKDESVKSSVNADSSTASGSTNDKQDVTSDDQGAAVDDEATKNNDQEEEDEDSDADDLAEGDEDESDLDLAFKMLDVARVIVEKQSGNTMQQVEILSALADVSLEREDFETSLSDYQKALSILEQLVEPDDRKITDLNFRVCLCLEVGSKPEEAIVYCQKALSVCKAQIHRLTNEVKSFSDSASAAAELDQDVQTSHKSKSGISVADKQAEIETLTSFSSELEKKLEDLQQQVLNPKSVLAELLQEIASGKASNGKESSAAKVSSSQLATAATSTGGFDSPTISTAASNGPAGVTHLGVVGRGVKRASNASGAEASTPKKPALESNEDKGDGKAS